MRQQELMLLADEELAPYIHMYNEWADGAKWQGASMPLGRQVTGKLEEKPGKVSNWLTSKLTRRGVSSEH